MNQDSFNFLYFFFEMGFPHSSIGKESACNAGDPGLIPRLGRSVGEGQAATPVFLGFPGDSDGKETTCNAGDLGFHPRLGRSLCWEDPLEKGMANNSSILAMVRGAWQAIVHEAAKSQTQLSNFHFHDSYSHQNWSLTDLRLFFPFHKNVLTLALQAHRCPLFSSKDHRQFIFS